MATSKEIDQCLAALAVGYPFYDKQQANPDLARKIFHQILSDIDGALLEAAALQWLSTARPFHPSPGELRDLALRLIEHDDQSADEAWSEVLNALQRYGSYWTPNWSNAAIAKTMQAFGRWIDFCLIETDHLGIVRAQFLRIYEVQRVRAHDDRLMLPETRQRIEALSGQTAKRLGTGQT